VSVLIIYLASFSGTGLNEIEKIVLSNVTSYTVKEVIRKNIYGTQHAI